MINVFGKNHEEIGSLDKNLVLQTKGKVKIRYGRKYIDLLDNNGNINVKIPKILKKVNSKDEIVPDGIYLYDGDLYANIGGEIIQFTGSVEGDYLIYSSDLELTQEQIELVWKNLQLNKLEGLTLNEPLSSINNSGLNYPSDNVMLVFKNGNWQYVTYNSGNTNNLESSSSSGGGISSGQFSPETLKDLESETPFITNPLNWETKDNKKLLDLDKINPNNNGIKVGAISTDHLISYGTEFKETTKTIDDQEVVQDYSYPRYSDILNDDLLNNHSDGEGYGNVVPTIAWVKKFIESGGTLKELLTALNEWNTLIETDDKGGVLLHTHQNGKNYFSWRDSLYVILDWMSDVEKVSDLSDKYLYCKGYNDGNYEYTWKKVEIPESITLNLPLEGINNADLGSPLFGKLILSTYINNGVLSWKYTDLPEVPTLISSEKEWALTRQELVNQASPPGTIIMSSSNSIPYGWRRYAELYGKLPGYNLVGGVSRDNTTNAIPILSVYYYQRLGEPYFKLKLKQNGTNVIRTSTLDLRSEINDIYKIGNDYYSIFKTNTSDNSNTFSINYTQSDIILYPMSSSGLFLNFNQCDVESLEIYNIYQLNGWNLVNVDLVTLSSNIYEIQSINFSYRTNQKLELIIQNTTSIIEIIGSNIPTYFLGETTNLTIKIPSGIINGYRNSSSPWSVYNDLFVLI